MELDITINGMSLVTCTIVDPTAEQLTELRGKLEMFKARLESKNGCMLCFNTAIIERVMKRGPDLHGALLYLCDNYLVACDGKPPAQVELLDMVEHHMSRAIAQVQAGAELIAMLKEAIGVAHQEADESSEGKTVH